MGPGEDIGDNAFSQARRALLFGGVAGALAAGKAAAQSPAHAPAPAAGAEPLRTVNRNGFETILIPTYSDDIMRVTNLHEFEDIGKTKVSQLAYDYIRAGAADDLTLKANREAFGDYWIRRRIMTDCSRVDCSIELFGQKYEHPVMLGPVGLRRLMHPDGDRLTALAAHQSKAILVGARIPVIKELAKQGTAPVWWASSLGYANQAQAEEWVARNTEAGASALCISMDYPYTGARDLPSRHHWESQWSEKPEYNTPDGPVTFQAGMIFPYFPAMRWEWLSWVRNASKLPLIVKGITNGDDAIKAVKAGADAISVSNHGGRTLDGAISTLHALPEVVDAVGSKVPVIMDGGVRRGGDVLKATALGATAVIIGRPYLWALASFGQEGVQRCIEVLQGETRIALGLSGAGTFDKVDRSLIRPAWKARTA
ncbi:MAG: alpha-hydroxy acid oxidase [Sphingobium sp.]